MSIFQLQDYWTISLSQHGEGNDDEYDLGCIAVGNFDNSSNGSDKIAVGSLKGILRVYNPSGGEYKLDDLLVEENLEKPILQLLCGRFIPSSLGTLGLAILHPRSLAVYELVPKGPNSDKASFYILEKQFEVELGVDGSHFTAYNMVCGPFGGIRNKDMILVQSMDGKLQFFEDSTVAMIRQFSDCLIPGPLVYVNRIDAFVTCTYACRAECYKYQALASAQSDIGAPSQGGGFNKMGLLSIRMAIVEWSLNLGEPCRQIVEGKFISGDKKVSVELIFLCENSIFLVKDSGGIMQMRRLDRSPLCISSYVVNPASNISNFILANADGSLQIYSEFSLIWAAKCQGSLPVDLAVCSIASQRGLIATVCVDGILRLGYVGTKPPVSTVSSYSRDLDYDKIDEEHKSLLQLIRDSQTDGKVESSEKLGLKIQVVRAHTREIGYEVEVPSDAVTLSYCFGSNARDGQIHMLTPISIFLTVSGAKSVSNVSISAVTPGYVQAIPNNVQITKLSSSNAARNTVKMEFYALKSVLPSHNTVQIMATYTASNGDPQIKSLAFELPLILSCRVKPATKSAIHKFVIDTEGCEALPLTDLFDDFLLANQENGIDVVEVLGSSASHAMGFQFWFSETIKRVNDEGLTSVFSIPVTASILVSKANGRYRVQSDSLPVVLFLMMQLEKRLHTALQKKYSGKYSISCQESLQAIVDDLCSVLSEHHEARLNLQKSLSQLNDLAHQYRVVDKRLLVRFKDRNPAPLGGLEILLRETYKSIIMTSDTVEGLKDIIRKKAEAIDVLARGLSFMCALKFGLSPDEKSLLDAHLCPNLTEGSEQGWEETVEVSLTYLLKTSLAKAYKDTALLGTNLEMSANTDSLKKILNIVIDRLSKGLRLIPPS